MKRLTSVLGITIAALVLASAPPASAQTITLGKSKVPFNQQTAGSDGTAALNNLTFTVPGAVIAKYATWGDVKGGIVAPILKALDIVSTGFKNITSKNINNGAVKELDLAPEVRAKIDATVAALTKPVESGDIKDGTVSTSDLAPEVKDSLAKAGTPGPPGPQGAPGAPGAGGGALAYARVFANGTLDTGISKNIEMLSSATGGIYCLRYTAGEPHIINTTVDVGGADGGVTLISGTADKPKIDAAGACPATTNIQVVTAHSSTHAPLPANFYLTVVF